MGVYVGRCKPQRIYIDADGNQISPPWEGGNIINHKSRLVEPPTEEEIRKRGQTQAINPQAISLDAETLKALALLKEKGLI